MKNYYYPAIFHTAEEGGYWITFPDFEYIFSQGETLEDASDAARDALGLELYSLENEHKSFPMPTSPNSIKLNKGEHIILIEFDYIKYKRQQNNQAVKKTLSIPGWLNEEAIKRGINFSAVLQKALKQELDL